MRYRITHTTKYAYSEPVAICHNLARLTPRESAEQTLTSHRLAVAPEPAEFVRRTDLFGNRIDYFSLLHSHSALTLSATSEVRIEERATQRDSTTPWESVRESLRRHENADDAQAYRFVIPSTHTPEEPVLRDYAASSFPQGRPLLDAARELTTRIYEDFEYNPKATTVSTPVLEAFESRVGVCQDFAHTQIAMLRSLGLAARYVSGYLRTKPPEGKPRLIGADATHAWISVYCGRGLWVNLDPTNDCIPAGDHVLLTLGRDYADVAPVQGVFVGGGSHSLQVSVDVAPLDERPSNGSNR